MRKRNSKTFSKLICRRHRRQTLLKGRLHCPHTLKHATPSSAPSKFGSHTEGHVCSADLRSGSPGRFLCVDLAISVTTRRGPITTKPGARLVFFSFLIFSLSFLNLSSAPRQYLHFLCFYVFTLFCLIFPQSLFKTNKQTKPKKLLFSTHFFV